MKRLAKLAQAAKFEAKAKLGNRVVEFGVSSNSLFSHGELTHRTQRPGHRASLFSSECFVLGAPKFFTRPIAMATACSTGLDTGFATLDFGQIVVLGLVQGVTELLPISSTAHMRVVPALLGWPDPGSAFSALMQLAALAAVISYFRRDLGEIAGGALDGLRTRRFTKGPSRLALGVVLATIPIVIAGIALAPGGK